MLWRSRSFSAKVEATAQATWLADQSIINQYDALFQPIDKPPLKEIVGRWLIDAGVDIAVS